jgi:hypothetical protein
LLVGRNSKPVLDFGHHAFQRFRGTNFEEFRISSNKIFHENLKITCQSHLLQVQSGSFLNVVVIQTQQASQTTSVEHESLLKGGNSFLVLDFFLHTIDRVRGFNIEFYCFSSKSFHENLHIICQSPNQVHNGSFLNVVVIKSISAFQITSVEHESLLIGGNSFLVLDFGLHDLDWFQSFNIESYCFSRKSFHENLHFICRSHQQKQNGSFSNVVVRQIPSVFQLISIEHEFLSLAGNFFLLLDFSFHHID